MPKQNKTFLGSNINSRCMKISQTNQKKETLWLSCQTLQNNPKQTIRYKARIVDPAKKQLTIDPFITNILRKILLSQKGIRDVVWWHEHIMGLENDTDRKSPSRIIYSDASNRGLVTHFLKKNKYHINAKELLAVGRL